MLSAQRLLHFLKLVFYFFLGGFSTALVLISASYLIFTAAFQNKIYPGVTVNHLDLTGQTLDQVEKNLQLADSPVLNTLTINITHPKATVSALARDLRLRPDTEQMAKRVLSIGRQTKNPYYNFLQIFAAWQGKINLPVQFTLDKSALLEKTASVAPLIEKKPTDAVFKFENGTGPDRKGRVVAFIPSENGLLIDNDSLFESLKSRAESDLPLSGTNQTTTWTLPLPTKVVPPAITSSLANKMGIKDLLGRGESYFYDSIPGRVYNIKLGSDKITGSLIAPGEIFSFDQAIGTVSAVFGFQKAYAIIKGKTVLDDGGGVCQVSTTLYRAALNSGLPIIERTAHTYRVGFYEQGGFLPGLDATVYPPSPDLKIKNDTGHWILVQAIFDPSIFKLTFELFGTNDGRKTVIQGPYILSTSPPPDPIYEDDPTKPVGTITQVDTAHYGAKVYFKRIVSRVTNDKSPVTLINETVYSDFVPWPARYLKGTKT